MTREETKKILRIMCSTYPNYKPSDLSETIDIWQMVLSDYSYQQIATGLKAYILSDTTGFAPSVGQIVDKIKTIEQPVVLNESEAWGMVSKAIRNGYYGAVEEFAKLPPLVQKAVGTPDNLRNWSQTNLESIETVIQSNFLRSYRVEAQRAGEISKMPSDIKTMIENMSQNSYSAQIANKNESMVKSLTDKTKMEYGANNDVTTPMPDDWRTRLSEGWEND